VPKRNREESQEERQEDTNKRWKSEYADIAEQIKEAVDVGNLEEVTRLTSGANRLSWEALVAEDPEFLINAGYSNEILRYLLESYKDEIGKLEINVACKAFLDIKNIEALLSFYPFESIDIPEYNDKLSAIKQLLDNKISYHDYDALYHALIDTKNDPMELATAFTKLCNAGISYLDHETLYQFLIDFHYCANALANDFLLLWNFGITYQDNKGLYLDMLGTDARIKLYDVLKLLNDVGIEYAHHARYYNCNVLFANQDLTIYFFRMLSGSGYSLHVHAEIFNVYLNGLCSSQPERMRLMKLVNELCHYAKNNRLLERNDPAYDMQRNDLDLIVANAEGCKYTAGPLNKSKATTLIERLLNVIVKQDSVDLRYNASGHYILSMSGKIHGNLSLLIKNANLSQLILSDELVLQIGEYLEKVLGNTWLEQDDSPSIINSLLSDTHQKAISIYITECYTNINKLFRMEELDSRAEHCLVNQDNNNKIVYFLLGCLLNDAANKLKYLPDQSAEKQCLEKISAHYKVKMSEYVEDEPGLKSLLEKSLRESVITIDEKECIHFDRLAEWYPNYTLLDRGERLGDEEHQRRKANVWGFPALTSFSASKAGSPYFHEGNTTRTKLEIGRHYPIVNPDEDEVILPHGEQVLTTEGPEGLSSIIINSPLFEKPNHYWSDLALTNAFEHYLTKEYTQECSVITIDGIEIVRPNHNVTHTYRVMMGIDLVIDYFSEFAEDKMFKAFCHSLLKGNIEWLRICAAFSITGRESEIAATENLALYDTYREASARHLEEFASQSIMGVPQLLVDRIVHVLRYMGNPNYECEVTQPVINDISDESERMKRNFCHRILTIAHKLDLSRCYSPDEYRKSMKPCLDLSVKTEAQKNKLNEIMSYMMQVTKAHGGRLSCDMQPDGTLVDVNTSYESIYAESSTSLKRLFELTALVPRPSQYLGNSIPTDSFLEMSSSYEKDLESKRHFSLKCP
jgi:hypothetical protein